MADEIYVRVKSTPGRSFTIKSTAEVNVNREIPGLKRFLQSKANGIAVAKTPFFRSKNRALQQIYRIKLNDATGMDELIKELKSNPDIEIAERIPIRKIIAVPSDTSWADQWSLQKIKAQEAWDVGSPVQTVVVAVVDNAIETNHPDLAANMLAGYDVSDNDTNPNPPNTNFSHGTHVSGIVGAVTNNVRGIASAGNNQVKILPVKATSNSSFYNYIDNGFEGIQWAAANGAKIISLSWGGPGFSQLEQDIITDVYNQGVLIVAAAGNEDSDELQYPASYDHVISVASLDSDDKRSYFSSYGSKVDIAAPGRFILSTIPFNSYASYSGTSMATPLVSACAGYLLACFPTLSADSVELVLKKTSDDIDANNPDFAGQLGAGRINLLTAVACKNSTLFDQIPQISPSNFFCAGDSITASIELQGGEITTWLLNDLAIGNSSEISIGGEGNLILRRTLGSCVLDADPILLIHNKTYSQPPLSSDLETVYCDSITNFLVATPSACSAYGPETFIYEGPQVGFDGYERSGDYPSVEVSGLGGLIDSVTVSITWQKKDGGTAFQCDLTDQGLRPFNEEVSFQLQSPDGTVINLVNEGTYNPGTTTSGVVTTVFKAGAPAILNGSLPASGTFSPAGDLTLLHGKISQGKWTLIANDNYLIDPLCVSGFSVTIKSVEPSTGPVFSWYDAGGSKTTMNDTLMVNAAMMGVQNFSVTQQCEGMCPSSPAHTSAVFHSSPELYAFKQSDVLLNLAQIQEVQNAQSVQYSKGSGGDFHVEGINAYGNPFAYKVADRLPLVSPAVICKQDNYLILADYCNGTVHWDNSWQGFCLQLENISIPYQIKVTCVQSWGSCEPMADIPFDFTHPIHDLYLTKLVPSYTQSEIIGKTITSSQLVLSEASMHYSAPESILLNPGFETRTSTVFKAEIGDCPAD